MAHNKEEGWTRLTSGDQISIFKTTEDGKDVVYIWCRGPAGGGKFRKRLGSGNIAELIAALIIASDDKTLRTASKMVQRIGLPRPHLTRSEVWAIVHGYDVDNPQEHFGDPSAADQCAAFMHAMQPDPGKPPDWDELRLMHAMSEFAALKVGETLVLSGATEVVKLAGPMDADQQWIVWDGGERFNCSTDEVVEMFLENTPDEETRDWAREKEANA